MILLLRAIYELVAEGDSYDEITAFLSTHPPKCLTEATGAFTFRFRVEGNLKKLTGEYQMEVINRFKFLPFGNGVVDLTSEEVDVQLQVVEDHSNPDKVRIYLLRLVALSNRVNLDQFGLKKRPFLWTTSMDTEMTFIMANQALIKPGSLVLDPFVGTGSILVPVALFGGYAVGTDIDGRIIRGSGKPMPHNARKRFFFPSVFL